MCVNDQERENKPKNDIEYVTRSFVLSLRWGRIQSRSRVSCSVEDAPVHRLVYAGTLHCGQTARYRSVTVWRFAINPPWHIFPTYGEVPGCRIRSMFGFQLMKKVLS